MDGYFVHVANRLDKVKREHGVEKSGMLGELKTWDLWRAVFAEFIATLVFVFIVTMSAVALTTGDDIATIVRIALTFGFMIATCIHMIGHISGGHMNPAVSIAMAVTMSISPIRAALYIVAQCSGAILGSLLLKGVTPDSLHSNLGLNSIHTSITAAQGFGCEVVFTFILVFSIYGCTDPNRPLFGSPAVGIGLTVAVIHLAGIPFTGVSINPARSLGPSVVSEDFDDHWVFWVGPILGGVLAALSYKFMFDPYRRKLTTVEAAHVLLGDPEEVIAIPKSYFKGGSDGKVTSLTAM